MTGVRTKSSRRAFFLQGSAAVGAGVATTVGVASPLPSEGPPPLEEQLRQLRQQLDCVADREAIRQLHGAFTTLIEQQAYEAAAELFDERAQLDLSGASAIGKPAIRQLLVDQYRRQSPAVIHGAYRQSTAHLGDTMTLSGDRQQATATFHVEVQQCTPLQGDCTAAKMARLQGHVTDRRWETGRLEAKYVKTAGQWKMTSLSYLPS